MVATILSAKRMNGYNFINKKDMSTKRCYCLRTRNGNMICPLTTERRDLEKTFNYQVRGDEIIEVEVDNDFVCNEERTDRCKNCPFK